MHREAEVLAVVALLATLALAFQLAKSRRPGQGENVEVEVASASAAEFTRVLRRSRRRQPGEKRKRGEMRYPDIADQGRAILQAGWKAQLRSRPCTQYSTPKVAPMMPRSSRTE